MTTTKDLRHTGHIKAKQSAVYGALMDSKKHTVFTGAPAKISRKVGGAFSAHGPHLKGINVDLSKNKRILLSRLVFPRHLLKYVRGFKGMDIAPWRWHPSDSEQLRSVPRT